MPETPLAHLLTSATLLARAAQWDAARALLQATEVSPAERPQLQLALAEIAVDQDFAQSTTHSPTALADLADALAAHPDPTLKWDRAMLRLRNTYFTKLVTAATTDGGLAVQAEALQAEAPDDARRAAVLFYRGLIADNLNTLPDEAFKHYTDSLALCESTGDTLQASYAHRHLGDHAHTAGNLTEARRHWQLSTEQRQAAGHVPGTLAQQALLAVLANDEGNPTAAQAIATETNRWAQQLNLTYVAAQTNALLHKQ
ncbi:hypothetical protein [Kribbella lupini]|uniref:Tetratricopeptide repeat protein n=1 Tax=Kribbella lupini TaxID=291602 RepID=A0ABP4LEW7_9ACTN